ncbi:MAG: hypothetical protein RL213_719 [Bacteroidota bacterium]
MTPPLILSCVIAYSALLFFVVWLTSRKADNDTYFIGNRSSRWYLVAYGMIGASLSGVTFMSVPGWVGTTQFSYMMVVFGYLAGYTVIATVLLPLYYRMNLTSIYSYLESRLGPASYRTGAFYFLLSRTIGASFRLYIVINVLQSFVFDAWGVPFWLTTAAFIVLILLYTYEGGVKTIVWTDTLQTTFMLASLIMTIWLVADRLGISFDGIMDQVFSGPYSRMVVTDWTAKNFFLKHFFGGMFIAIAMTGLDQEMMQKNISVKTLRGAQTNMMTFSVVLVIINLLFLSLGVLLYSYAAGTGLTVPSHTDDLFPVVALGHLGTVSALFFIIGLISAAYPSADGALTALTASFCIDFVGLNKRGWEEPVKKRVRHAVHIGFAMLLLAVIVIFRMINDEAVIGKLFTVAGYTYGPLLGLFAFGILTRRSVPDRWVPFLCLLPPVICYMLNENSVEWLNGYRFGFELLILNGLITFLGLFIVSFSRPKVPAS